MPDRLLMGPGPSNPYPEVTAALVEPVLGHLDPAFLAVLDDTMARLRTVFATANPLTLPLSGTGSAGMEASFVNLVRPGDPVVVAVNGLFGERMCEVADRAGAEVIRVETPWGRPVDPAAVLSAHRAPAIIAVVHAETSTGVCNDVAAIAAGKGDALVVADTVTSLGGMPVAVDDWGVDVAYSGTQKCLGVPPGLAPLTVSPRARRAVVARPSSWYLDLNLLARYVEAGEGGGRVYHHTAPVTMITALHAGLGAVLDEGLPAVWERHERCGRQLQDGLEAMGLELFAEPGSRLAQLTTVKVPDRLPRGLSEAGCRRRLLDEYDIEIGAGAGPLAGSVWRIGCMGHTARPANVAALLGALAEVLEVAR
jgi:alanine-glyoxylate transaminase/serine-glyoxylate transaminase/serine-pyruvate transaminase